MATLNPVTKKFTYTASDERLISNARSLFQAVSEYDGDADAKRDANTAYQAAKHVLEHIAQQRQEKAANGKILGK